MATEAQLSANTRNAQFSTGPRTQAGRARSSMNALKSGIHAKSEIIPGEDPEELAQLTAEYYDSIQPQGREEAVLVDQVISADWQLRRLRHTEAGIFTKFIDQPSRTASGWAYMKNSDILDRLYRNQAATARNLRASLDSLLRLRKTDLLQPQEQNEPNSPSMGYAPVAPAASSAAADPAPEPLPIAVEQPLPPPTDQIDKTNPNSESYAANPAETNPIPEAPYAAGPTDPASQADPQLPLPASPRPPAPPPLVPQRVPVFHYKTHRPDPQSPAFPGPRRLP